MNREVMCLESIIDSNGHPIFKLLCDCGTVTDLIIEDLSIHSKTNATELAYTCNGCSTSHWMTIEKIPEND